jgi:DNA-binding SARP family transcriptional activator
MHNWLNSIQDQKRIVVLHPHYRSQRQMIWQPIMNERTLYVRFEGDALKHTDLIEQWQSAHTQQEAQKTFDFVILDEIDRINDTDLLVFVKDLLNRFSARFILVTRSLPTTLMFDPLLHPLIEFKPTDNHLLYDYSQQMPDTPLLEVSSFGKGRVVLNGHEVTEWDGILPRMLFFFFIDKGMVTRDEIFETFWPNMTIREATNVFHVTKRKINEVLGIDLMTYTSGFYCLSANLQLRYDVMLFNQMLQDSEISEFHELEGMLLSSIHLYRGDFLVSSDNEWVLRRRREMRQTYGDALFALAMLYEQVGKHDHAKGYFLRAYHHSPLNPQYAQRATSLLETDTTQ